MGLALLVSGTARAQDAVPDAAAADLFRKGRELIGKGDFEHGCERFRASYARFPAASSALNIAKYCEERAGRIASAWALYERALVLNRETPGEARRASLGKIARDGVERLKPRLPRLLVRLQGAVPAGVEVVESGAVLPLGEAVPLDPGVHDVEVRAPGYERSRKRVELREGERTVLEFELKASEPKASPKLPGVSQPTPKSGPAVRPASRSAAGPEEADSLDDEVPTWAWISGGAGVLLSVAGTVFLVDALAANSDLEARCGEDLICDEDPSFDPEPLNSRRKRGVGLAIGLGGAGVVALVASLIGIATSGSAKASANRGTPRVVVSRTETGWCSSFAVGF